MFYLEATDGRTFAGREINWDQIPEDVVVSKLCLHLKTTMGSTVANHELRDFDAFGFQRYDHVLNDGRRYAGGCQLLAKKGETILVVDVDFSSGLSAITSVHESACGYNPSLWRRGCSKL